MIYLTHTYFETPHAVTATFPPSKREGKFLSIQQPPTLFTVVNHSDKSKKSTIKTKKHPTVTIGCFFTCKNRLYV